MQDGPPTSLPPRVLARVHGFPIVVSDAQKSAGGLLDLRVLRVLLWYDNLGSLGLMWEDAVAETQRVDHVGELLLLLFGPSFFCRGGV